MTRQGHHNIGSSCGRSRFAFDVQEASFAKRIERQIEALQRGRVATFDLRPMRKRGRGSDGEFDMRPMKRTIDANHIRPMKRGGDVENDNRLCHNNGKDQCVTKDPDLTYSSHLVRGHSLAV